MTIQTTFTDQLIFNGSVSGGTFSWNSPFVFPNAVDIFDVNDDTNLDSTDYLGSPSTLFTGFYYVAPNGQTFAIFGPSGASSYRIPYNSADYDLAAVFPGSGSTTNFQANDFSPTGNLICFLPGSLIATPQGETRVEELRMTDQVLTAVGDAIPVKWIGRQTVSTRFNTADRLRPVRFAAGSLGNGLPHSHLTVTADHAMLVDGVLCNASVLVNDVTIIRVPLEEMGESFTVYHIETETHEIILANGAETETYIDHTSRRAFDNYAEYEALYGDEPEMTELRLPRITTRRQLTDQIRHFLNSAQAA